MTLPSACGDGASSPALGLPAELQGRTPPQNASSTSAVAGHWWEQTNKQTKTLIQLLFDFCSPFQAFAVVICYICFSIWFNIFYLNLNYHCRLSFRVKKNIYKTVSDMSWVELTHPAMFPWTSTYRGPLWWRWEEIGWRGTGPHPIGSVEPLYDSRCNSMTLLCLHITTRGQYSTIQFGNINRHPPSFLPCRSRCTRPVNQGLSCGPWATSHSCQSSRGWYGLTRAGARSTCPGLYMNSIAYMKQREPSACQSGWEMFRESVVDQLKFLKKWHFRFNRTPQRNDEFPTYCWLWMAN